LAAEAKLTKRHLRAGNASHRGENKELENRMRLPALRYDVSALPPTVCCPLAH
jgi:hypothetical protein